jgi:DNA-binding XRE family transcriptional regulator
LKYFALTVTERSTFKLRTNKSGIDWNDPEQRKAHYRKYSRKWRKANPEYFLSRTRKTMSDAKKQTKEERACSLEDAAKVLGVSRERVRQIENEALRKLRLALKVKGLTLKDLLPELGQSTWQEMMSGGEGE